MVENEQESIIDELQPRRDFFVLEMDAKGDLKETYAVQTTKPADLLEKIRCLSGDDSTHEIIVITDNHQRVLHGKRNTEGQWQLEVASSALLKHLQTDIRKGQWSKQWLFETDRPKRKRFQE